MSDNRKNKPSDINECYNVCDVVEGFKYYQRVLTEKCLGMFKFENCPKNLKQEQLEKRIITDGYAIVFKHQKYGLVTSPSSIYGEDIYFMPTKATYTQVVLGSGNLVIGKNCAIIYNSAIDTEQPQGLTPLIDRYARLLADFDSSIANIVINSRSQKMGMAKSANAAIALKDALTKVYAGAPATINTNTFIDMVKTLDWSDNNNIGVNVDKLLTSRTKTMSDFLQEIGVKSAFEKNERLITDEVAANDQLLTINTDDMLYYRQEGVKMVNELFGTNIKVRHNSAYFIKGNETTEEGKTNDTE